MHVVRDSSGETNVSESAIQTGVDLMNDKFSNICVSFEICEFNYIDNFLYDSLRQPNALGIESTDALDLENENKKLNRINVYYTQTLDVEDAAGYASLGGITSLSSSSIHLVKTSAIGYTLTHEMGHFFGLLHTWEGSHLPGSELVDGSNCETSGDGICDTPADPYVNDDSSSKDCDVLIDKKDINGQYYTPILNNIMSYYQCRCNFTCGQYNKMVDTYLNGFKKSW